MSWRIFVFIFKRLIYLFLFYVYLPACMDLYHVGAVPVGARSGCQNPWNRTKDMSSHVDAGKLIQLPCKSSKCSYHWAISLAPERSHLDGVKLLVFALRHLMMTLANQCATNTGCHPYLTHSAIMKTTPLMIVAWGGVTWEDYTNFQFVSVCLKRAVSGQPGLGDWAKLWWCWHPSYS